MQPSSVYAYNREKKDNASEKNAWELCTSTTTSMRGALWFNTTSGTTNDTNSETGYYYDKVIVPDTGTDTSVNVWIRGSVFSCRDTSNVDTGVANVGPDPRYSDSVNRLRMTGSIEFHRGFVNGDGNWSGSKVDNNSDDIWDGDWADQGGQIPATIDVSNIPMTDNGDGTSSGSIDIFLYRCFKNYSTGITSTGTGCYSDTPVTINVIKTNNNWNIQPESIVDRDTVLPGETVTWTHKVTNLGPNATDQPIIYRFEDRGYLSGNTEEKTRSLPLEANGFDYFNSTYTVPTIADDPGIVGQLLCRITIASPSSSTTLESVESDQSCVTVSGGDSMDDPVPTVDPVDSCDPIKIKLPKSPTQYIQNGDIYTKFTNNGLVPISVSVDVKNTYIGEYYNPTFDFVPDNYKNDSYSTVTRLLTTGDKHTAYYETDKYISGYYSVATYKTVQVQEAYTYYTYDGSGGSSAHTGTRTVSKQVFDKYAYYANYKQLDTSSSISACYNYTLKPAVNTGSDSIVEAGQNFTVNTSVTNPADDLTLPSSNADKTKSAPTNWSLTRIILNPGGAIIDNNSDYSASPNCSVISTHFSNVKQCLDNLKNGNSVTYPISTTNDNISFTAEDYNVGTKICFVFSVSPFSSGNISGGLTWRNSKPTCLTVGKKPKVQIWGGDLSANNIQTSISTKNILGTNRTFGSWVEYGIFAMGNPPASKLSVIGMASGSAFSTNTGSVNKCDYSTLTFANIIGSCDSTKYNRSTPIPAVEASFSGGISLSTGTYTTDSLSAGIYDAGSNNLTLNSSTLLDKSIIIKTKGIVTIAGNQSNKPGPYSSISQIPQLVIIADKIIITDDTTIIDAWLIAKNDSKTGSIKTCSNEAKTAGVCSSKLIVNGPVMADKLYLYRTYGAGVGYGISGSGAPAEVFNLRADAYLWAYAWASKLNNNGSTVQTVYSTELPVRL